MKNLGLTLLALAITLNVFAQNKETRNLPSFDEVSVGESIDVIVTEGDSEKAIVEVSGVDLEDVITEMRGSTLDIHMARGNYRNIDVKIYVTYKSLKGINVGSAASLESKSVIKSNEFEINVNSAGYSNLELDVESLETKVNSGGKLDVSGTCNYHKVNVNSGGRMFAFGLSSSIVRADVSSGGKAELSASKELDADANSGGRLIYKGNPDRVNTDSGSGGRVSKY